MSNKNYPGKDNIIENNEQFFFKSSKSINILTTYTGQKKKANLVDLL